jgi:hypothetical protein
MVTSIGEQDRFQDARSHVSLQQHAQPDQQDASHQEDDEQERFGYDEAPDRIQTPIPTRLIT